MTTAFEARFEVFPQHRITHSYREPGSRPIISVASRTGGLRLDDSSVRNLIVTSCIQELISDIDVTSRMIGQISPAGHSSMF